MKKMNRLSGLLCVLVIGHPTLASAAEQLSVCNEGEYAIEAAVLSVNEYLGGNSRAEFNAWHTIRPGACPLIFYGDSVFGATVYVGFAQRDANGNLHPLRFHFESRSDLRDPLDLDTFCPSRAPLSPTTGTATEVVSGLRPPCDRYSIEVETSAKAVLLNGNITLHIGAGSIPAPPALPGEGSFDYSETVEMRERRFASIFFPNSRTTFREYMTNFDQSGTSPRNVPGSGELADAVVLICNYRPAAEAAQAGSRHRKYFFWTEEPSLRIQDLVSLHEHHPFLLIGAPRAECPISATEAHAEVSRNLQ